MNGVPRLGNYDPSPDDIHVSMSYFLKMFTVFVHVTETVKTLEFLCFQHCHQHFGMHKVNPCKSSQHDA